MKYYQSPINKGWVNFEGHKEKKALDLGWSAKANNPNQDVLAIWDGVVIDTSYYNDGGNVVGLELEWNSTHKMWVLLQHMQNKAIVKVGDKVKRNQKLGNMGNTGISKGNHVHVRMALVPINAKYSINEMGKYTRLYPYDYLYQYPNQDVTDMKVLPKDTTPKLTNVKGVLTVTTDKGLNERTEPNTKAKVVKTNKKGTKLNYVGWLSDGKYYWYKLTNGNYTAYRIIGGEKYATYKDDVKPVDKPKDRYATVGGNQTLYKSSTGDSYYGKKVQNLKSRQMKVLNESNGRVQVQAGSPFDVPSFWVSSNKVTIK